MAGNANSGRRDLSLANTPLQVFVRDQPPVRWGPAMAALPLHGKAFVVARVVHRMTYARAYEAAGGSSADPETLKKSGKHFAMRPDVAAAIVEEVNRMAGADSVTFYANMKRIAGDAKVKAETRLKANALLLERGAPQAQLIKVEHDHQLTISQETLSAVEQLEAGFGRALSDESKRKLGLLAQPEVVDAEFEPVATDEWSVP